MNIESFASWLIHSDLYLLAIWAVVLAAALVITFTGEPAEAVESSHRELPPTS